jgi:hypothetical protein
MFDIRWQDAGSQQIGFLLGSCGIQVALTSEACLKGLPKTAAGEVVAFKGWPKLQWFVTEHLAKTPKDWLPPPRLTDDTPAYIEVSRIFHTHFVSFVIYVVNRCIYMIVAKMKYHFSIRFLYSIGACVA